MLVMQRHQMCHAHDSHKSADGQIFCLLNSCVHHKSVSVATIQAALKSPLVGAALLLQPPFSMMTSERQSAAPLAGVDSHLKDRGGKRGPLGFALIGTR